MNKPIAVIVKSFLREECMLRLVSSIERHMGIGYRLYIADEEPVPAAKSELYERLKEAGHHIHIFSEPSPVSVTYARNRLVQSLEDEDFVLRVDDDFVLTDETDVERMRDILLRRPEIGAISGLEIQDRSGNRAAAGKYSPGQGYVNLDKKRRTLLKQLVPVQAWCWMQVDGYRFAYADFTRNFLLIRRQVFDTVSWNPKLMIQGEHLDFMLRLKRHGWALAFTPDSTHHHRDPPKRKTARSYRQARDSTRGEWAFKTVYMDCWGVDKVAVVYTGDPMFVQRGTNMIRAIVRKILLR